MFRMEGRQLEHSAWEWICWNDRPRRYKRVRSEGPNSWRLACPQGRMPAWRPAPGPIHDGRAPREGRCLEISGPKQGLTCVYKQEAPYLGAGRSKGGALNGCLLWKFLCICNNKITIICSLTPLDQSSIVPSQAGWEVRASLHTPHTPASLPARRSTRN